VRTNATGYPEQSLRGRQTQQHDTDTKEAKDNRRAFDSTNPIIMQSNYMTELEKRVKGSSSSTESKSGGKIILNENDGHTISFVQPFSFLTDDDDD
jgi:hypothetical protein